MKRFIGKRVIRVPKYRMLYLFLLVAIIFIVLANGLTNLYLESNGGKELEELIVNDAYGLFFKELDWGERFFYHDVYGFDFNLSKKVLKNSSNLKDLVIEQLGEPIIYIYNTFQTYKYKNSYYNSYNVTPIVTQASYILQEYLKDYKINSIVEEIRVAEVLKDNDIPYTNSYMGSRILMEQAKNNNPSIDYFIDVQLADRVYSETTANIDGVNYAKILFVVGTDNENSERNKNLMVELNNLLEQKNKELSRGVSLRGGVGYQGIYNQDFSDKVLLIQVGGKENTIDEVNRTLKIFAEVLGDYLEGRY